MSEHAIPADLDWIRAAPEDATGHGPWIEVAFGPDDRVYLRETSDPDNVVTTTRRKWDAFVLGVQAGEFDHFVAGFDEKSRAAVDSPATAGHADDSRDRDGARTQQGPEAEQRQRGTRTVGAREEKNKAREEQNKAREEQSKGSQR